jgi:adenine-specific DNA methylase
MFSHHVLKPERTPLEAHPWGTRFSSGSFSTLFDSRLIRALTYKNNPIDLVLNSGKVVRLAGLSESLRLEVTGSSHHQARYPGRAYVSFGDSSRTDLADRSVDLVVTDPPFMDNVHYSELADFFHSWLRRIEPFEGYPKDRETTRQPGEVQSVSADAFQKAITAVWRECHRVLRRGGLLAFTFHQARLSGWLALMKSLRDAELVVTAIQPVKAEMSTSVAKSAASEPNNLDSVVVCRKMADVETRLDPEDEVSKVVQRLRRLRENGIHVGRADITSAVRGAVLSWLTHAPAASETALEPEAERQVHLAIADLGS